MDKDISYEAHIPNENEEDWIKKTENHIHGYLHFLHNRFPV